MSAHKNRDEEFPDSVGASFQIGALPCGDRIKNDQRLLTVISFIGQSDEVAADLSGLFVVDPEDGFVSGIGDFFNIFRYLDFGG